MGWIKKFPKCAKHEPAVWHPQTFKRGNDKRWFRFADGVCVHCGRALVAFHPSFPQEERTETRRYVAWWRLDKEYEHASNTTVLPWGSETFDQRMHRTVNEALA